MDSSKLDPEDPLAQKALVVFCMRIMPLLLAPMATISTSRIAGWCINWHSAKRSSDKQSKEVNKNLERFLQVKRVETTYSLVDYVSFLCFTHCMIVWFKAVHFGLASLPTFDLSIIPSSSAFLLLVALFHSGFVPRSSWSATVLAVAYNLVLLHNQYGIIVFGVVDRETLMIIVRLFAGFLFCDHRKAACVQVFFMIMQAPVPAFRGSSAEELNMWWDVVLWQIFRQFIIVGPMWLMWYIVEYFVYQFSELIVSKAAVNASLTAARAVLASQCDAEAILDDDLNFQNPSLKTAHFLGATLEQLRDRSFLDFISVTDKERFQQFVSHSVKALQELGPAAASSLSVTLLLPGGRRREIQVYLSSVPNDFNAEGGPCHLLAMNEMREQPEEAAGQESLDQVEELRQETSSMRTKVPVQRETASKTLPVGSPVSCMEHSSLSLDNSNGHESQARLSADTLAFHAWSYGAEPPQPSQNFKGIEVLFDPDTLDLKTISLHFSQSASRQRAKHSLKECIVPGVWDQFSEWLQTATVSRSGTPAPAITPFVCPKLVSSVFAARSAELKRIKSKDGQSANLLLSLSDIRLRHFPRATRGGFARTMGRGTASCVSRTSLSDA
mmetsp:Transcript_65510/g.153268  ORF Transcript_65510/g.153268 Transcript_65510/m.153268 type:complete len:612 (-) Transcript_65510:63-1898(-)